MKSKLRLNAMIPKVLYDKLHMLSAETGLSMSAIVGMALAEYFARHTA